MSHLVIKLVYTQICFIWTMQCYKIRKVYMIFKFLNSYLSEDVTSGFHNHWDHLRNEPKGKKAVLDWFIDVVWAQVLGHFYLPEHLARARNSKIPQSSWLATSTSPWNTLEMQIIRPHTDLNNVLLTRNSESRKNLLQPASKTLQDLVPCRSSYLFSYHPLLFQP